MPSKNVFCHGNGISILHAPSLPPKPIKIPKDQFPKRRVPKKTVMKNLIYGVKGSPPFVGKSVCRNENLSEKLKQRQQQKFCTATKTKYTSFKWPIVAIVHHKSENF